MELGENIIMEVVGQKITPLSINPGRIVLTSLHVYFQPFNNIEVVSKILNSCIINIFNCSHCYILYNENDYTLI